MSRVFAAAVALCGGAFSIPARGVERDYIDPFNGGSWNTPGNWSGAAVPIPADDAVLGTLSTAANVNFDASYSSSLNSLTVDATQVAVFTFNQTTGGTVMRAATEYIGKSVIGNIYNQIAGTNACTTLELGYAVSGAGDYILGGSAALSALSETIGDGGSGSFSQNDSSTNSVISLNLSVGTLSTGSYTLNGGSLFVNNESVGGGLTRGIASFNQNGGTQSVSGTITISTSLGGNEAYTLSGGSLAAGTIALNIGGTFTQNGGTLNATTFNQFGGIINGTLQNQGTFNYSGGTFNGRLVNQGTLNFNADFTAGNGLENDSTFSLFPGRTIILNGLGLDNEGTLNLNGGTLELSTTSTNFNHGNFNLAGAFNLSGATLYNGGTLNLTNSLLSGAGLLVNTYGGTIRGQGTLACNFTNGGGTLLVESGTTRVSNGFANYGLVQMAGVSASLVSGGMTNTGNIQGFGGIGGSVSNSSGGTVEALGGTLVLGGGLSNNAGALLTASGPNKLLVILGLQSNFGTINLTGGTFDNNGNDLGNSGAVSGWGIFRAGTINNGSGLFGPGTIVFTGGTTTVQANINNAAGSSMKILYNPAVITGNLTNNGSIKVTGTTLTTVGTYSGGGSYLSDPATNLFQSNVTINSGGLMTGGNGDEFHFSGGNFINNGSFSNGGLLQSSDPATNNGTLTQSGPQIWADGATFTNNAGIATFGSDTGSAAAAPLSIIVYGGSVSLAASQHLSALTLIGGTTSITAGTTETNALMFGGTTNNWSGDLDLTANKMIVQAASGTKASVLANLQDQAEYGKTHAAGITSSAMPANMAIAVVDNGGLAAPLATFGGLTVDGSSILVAPELLGDANIDGRVNFADFVVLSNHFGGADGGWIGADFNGDGVTNFADFVSLSNSFGAVIGAPFTANRTADGALPDAGIAAVPEPASLVLLGLAAAILRLGKRRGGR